MADGIIPNDGVVIDVPTASLSADVPPPEPPTETVDTDGRIIIERLDKEKLVELWNTWAQEADAMEVQNLRGFIVRLAQGYVHTEASRSRATALAASAAMVVSDKLMDGFTPRQEVLSYISEQMTRKMS